MIYTKQLPAFILVCFCLRFSISVTGLSVSQAIRPFSSKSSASHTNSSTSIINLPTSIKSNLRVTCDSKLGNSINKNSCRDALQEMTVDQRERSYGWRDEGQFDVTLPYRFQSTDGLCFFEPILEMDATEANATGLDLVEAAAKLIIQCADRDPAEGGVADNIGMGKNLALTMEPYQPMVHCMDATGPPYDSCFDVFMSMPVSDGDTQFGGNTPRLSKVALPKRMTDSSHRCLITINSSVVMGDTESWYKIWTAARAVHAMCVRQGKAGIHLAVGQGRNLFVEISIENPMAA